MVEITNQALPHPVYTVYWLLPDLGLNPDSLESLWLPVPISFPLFQPHRPYSAFLEHAQLVAASGPLHQLSPPPGMHSPQHCHTADSSSPTLDCTNMPSLPTHLLHVAFLLPSQLTLRLPFGGTQCSLMPCCVLPIGFSTGIQAPGGQGL